MSRAIFTSILLAFTVSASAGDWSGEGDLGFNQVSGNSESESLAANFTTRYKTEKWSHELALGAFTASQDDQQSAESYTANFHTDYNLSEKTYAFGNLRYVADRFSGYDSQAALTAGIGKHFIDDGTTLLDAEAGVGYRVSELSDGEDENEAILTAKATYNRKLTETTQFESSWLAESGSDNTYLEGGVAVVVAMTEALGLKVSYLVKHNTEVPVDTGKTDRFTTIALNYQF